MIDALSMRVALAVLVLLAMIYTGFVARRDGAGSVAAAWLGALVAFTLGTLLFLGDGTPAQRYTAPLANMAAVLGGTLMIATARRVRGARVPWWLLATVVAGGGVSTLLEDPAVNAWAGGGYMLIALGACSGAAADELWHHRERAGSTEVRTIAITATVLTVFYTLRWVLYFLQGPEGAAFTSMTGSGVTALIQMASTATVTLAVAQLGDARSRVELERRATTDHLTGVLNRGELLVRAERALADGAEGSVVIADLDHFKRVNDTRGHAEGDRALVEFARAWRVALGPDDVLGRIGGDEFVMVLVGTSPEDAAAIAREVTRDYVASMTCERFAAPTASHGVAGATRGLSLSLLLARADDALYQAKRAGRDAAIVYRAPEPSTGAASR
ncbi:GGDEF domain-containing protein [Demequina iriomotensis]|uniref:GGDEF domain-containing protein n=1 Tax=Demequina iriomotensis TaxID=1536641 RepID=UPI0007855285|nr:GGDEF domain-containing protein [Demequina iriomotensis]